MTTNENAFGSSPAPFHRRPVAVVICVVVVLLALFVGRIWYLYQSRAEQLDLASGATQTLVLTPGDVTQAQVQTLITGLPITGTLRAKDTALIKSRVAGVVGNLSVREGDTVRAGQVIARVEPTEYDQRYQQSSLQAEAARAQVEIAQRQYDNNTALVKQGFISQTALDTSRANLDAAQANYRAAQAGAAVAQQSVSDTVLTTPITGTISRRLVQPGERIASGSPIVEVVDLSQLELQATISPSDALMVRVDQTARLKVEGSPDTITATVARINPSAQEGSRDVLIYLTIPAQAEEGLRQGLFAQGMLATGETQALAVPLDAVRTDKPQPYLQVVRNGRVHIVPAQTGARGVLKAATPGNGGSGETWVTVHALNESELDTQTTSDSGASDLIQPGDWVLRGTAGALSEGTAVKLPQSK